MEYDSLKWLKAIRLAKNLSTYQVAKEAGISQAYYWMIEAGRKHPPVRIAKRIAAVLCFPWTDFFRDVA